MRPDIKVIDAVETQIEQYMLENYDTIDYNDLTEEERLDVDDMREEYTRRYYDMLQEYEELED